MKTCQHPGWQRSVERRKQHWVFKKLCYTSGGNLHVRRVTNTPFGSRASDSLDSLLRPYEICKAFEDATAVGLASLASLIAMQEV